jgi:hypothetical protein
MTLLTCGRTSTLAIGTTVPVASSEIGRDRFCASTVVTLTGGAEGAEGADGAGVAVGVFGLAAVAGGAEVGLAPSLFGAGETSD